MHRSYSLRQSRAPTAAQIQTPAPPQSSTKSGRLFGGTSSLGLSFRKGAAGAFAPELAKRLSQLIKMEKSLMRSIELVYYCHVILIDRLRFLARGRKLLSNSLYGEKNVMTTSQMSLTNSGFLFLKSAN